MLVDLDDRPDVVAVIPTLARDIPRLQRCLDAVRASETTRRLAILCIVNAPTLDDAPLERAALDRDGVTVEVAGLNLGWAGGLVFGRCFTGDAALWLVQDDMLVGPDTLERLAIALDADPALGVVGPIVVGADGLVPAGSCGGTLSAEGRIVGWQPVGPTAPESLTGLEDLDYLPSRGMLLRAAVWDAVGGADPWLYPVQYVDVDLCFGMHALGLRHQLVVDATVAHAGSGSTPSGFGLFVQTRNAERFLRRWFPTSPHRDELADGSRDDRASPVGALGAALHPRLPAHLVGAVAQSAADTLLHLAGAYARERREALAHRTHTDAAIEQVSVALANADAYARTLEGEVARLRDSHAKAEWGQREQQESAMRASARADAEAVAAAVAAAQVDRLTEERDALQGRLLDAEHRAEAVESARLWKLTAPIRAIADRLRALRR